VEAEPEITVANRKELTYLLSQGAELEHALMCQYLYAAFSLKTEADGLPPDDAAQVEGWRRAILRIAGEEMLHWAVVQNLLAAVGSAPFVSRPHLPHQAKGYPPGVQLRLLPFGETALQHFIYLERPEGFDDSDGAGFDAAGESLGAMRPDEIVPRGQDFSTVGHLYRSCARGLAHLAETMGEDRLFIGPAFHQTDDSAFGWPSLGPITNLEQAEAAIGRIVAQGEGATGDWGDAHYGRFLAVRDEYLARLASDPSFDVVHPVVGAGVRAVEGVEPDVYITDAATAACSDLFNAVYELLLQMIARYFAFGHESTEQRAVLADTAVDLMFTAIKPLGLLLAGMPVGPEHPGATAGANFQLPYRGNFLLPHRRAAWIRFAERLDDLAAFASDQGTAYAEPRLADVAAALRASSTRLTEQIEAV
jgi:hypothetical protein